MGSGHILCYVFDVLVEMYRESGYSVQEAVRSIIGNNIYGVDIDQRASQLAYFSVMMKARQYDRRFFTRKNDSGEIVIPQPNIYAIIESDVVDRSFIDEFCRGNNSVRGEVDKLIYAMKDAKEYWIQKTHLFRADEYICSKCGAACAKPYRICQNCGSKMGKSKYDPSWVDEAEGLFYDFQPVIADTRFFMPIKPFFHS